MIPARIVSASLSPNVEADDVWVAIKTLLAPAKWKIGSARILIEKWFAKYLDNPQIVSFNSGRAALYAILRAFRIGAKDEVLVQAFTCVAVPNSVLWTGARPVYVDIDETLNMDPDALVKKISKKTKAIIVQHTFGTPANMETILGVAKKHNLLVIEDCAHSLGSAIQGKKVGTIGDAACFSFGRDKVVSSVFGGLALVSKKHTLAWERLKEIHATIPYPSYFWIFQQLIHPIAFSVILPLYQAYIGRIFLVCLQKAGILGFPVYPEEKIGKRPSIFPAKYPNGLAILLLNQLRKFDAYQKKRKAAVSIYGGNAPMLRYPLMVDNPDKLRARARKRGILLGNWYHTVIDPTGVSFASLYYTKGSCPRAEEASLHIVNLPTNISERDANRIKGLL